MKITVDMLKRNFACDKQVKRFMRRYPKSRFPDGVEVTVKRCLDAAHLFDWNWAANNLLSSRAWLIYLQENGGQRAADKKTDQECRAMAFAIAAMSEENKERNKQ